MNKLTALSKLANAYHYLNDSMERMADYGHDIEAQHTLFDKFGYIRRSLSIDDLKPQPKSAEGLNPAGPKFF
jgi:hypothetical protein